MNNETYAQPTKDKATLPAIEPIPPAQPSVLHKVFIGPDGLRAGWSLLIFVALFAAVAYCVNVVGHKLYPTTGQSAQTAASKFIPPSFMWVAEFLPFVVTVLLTWVMSKIERRPNSVYGFGDSRTLSHLLAGLAWGCICLSLLILTLVKTGFLVIDLRLLSGGEIVRYGAIWLFGFFLVGLFEEYLTRGYLQYTLTRGLAGFYQWAFKTRHSTALGFWTAAVILSTLFGLGHRSNPGESPIGLLSAGLVGIVFCLSLWRTGSLWWAIGFHASWDWAQSFLYGVADSGLMVEHRLLATHPVGKPILSGGATGPEGSVFILAILVLVIAIIVVTLPRSKYGKGAKVFDIDLLPA